MGWVFEYLGEDLYNQLRDKFGEEAEIGIDEKLATVLFGGEIPQVGRHEGAVTIDGKKYTIVITIKRKMPDNGLDYTYGENTYEVLINDLF